MPIYTKYNNQMEKVSAIKTKYNGEMVDISKIMTKVNGQMIPIFSHVTEYIKEWFGYPIQTAYSLAGNLLNYKLYGNTKQQLLPNRYTQLEYIESTGTQYIDTGYKVDYSTAQHLTVKTDMLITTASGYRLCGVGGSKRQFYIGMNSTRFAYGCGSTDSSVGTTQVDKWYNYEYSTKNGTFVVKDDSSVVANATFTFSSEYIANSNIYLFAYNVFDSATTKWQGKIKDFTVYYDNSVVLNLIPAKRNSDNVVGMYDLVNNVFHTNAGTGSFVAGPVAPTPDSPIEIKSVGDKTKNLFDKSLYDGHGWYYTSGGIADSPGNNATVVIRAIPNKTYYFKHCSVVGGSRVMYTTEENWSAGSPCQWILSRPTTIQPNAVDSFTVPSDAKWVFLLVGRIDSSTTATFAEQINDYMLSEEVLTADTPYVPYGYQIPIVVSGKNLFDNYKAELKPNTTYTISAILTAGTRKHIYTYSADNTQQRDLVSWSSADTGYKTVTFTTTANEVKCEYTTALTQVSELQLEQGSTATSYEPYHAPTTTPIYLNNPLRKVGTYSDVLSYDPQQVIRNVCVKVFDGTESWTYVASVPRFTMTLVGSIQADNQTEPLCSHYRGYKTGGSISASKGCGIYSGGGAHGTLLIKDTDYTTVEDFKAYLASQYAKGTPVIMLYPLATPVTEQLTVPALTLSEGTNIITVDTQTVVSDAYARGRVSQL